MATALLTNKMMIAMAMVYLMTLIFCQTTAAIKQHLPLMKDY